MDDQQPPRKGLLVTVYRNEWDATNGGATSRCSSFVLTWDRMPTEAQIFEVTKHTPELRIVERIIGGRPYLHARPADVPAGVHTMMGGNFVWTSDSRFPNRYPIPVHDRIELPVRAGEDD